MAPRITYLGMTENPAGGWKTSYRVEVERSESLAIDDINGPHAGARECLLAVRLQSRGALTYRPKPVANQTGHFIMGSRRPRRIRIWRALQPYPRHHLPFGNQTVVPHPGTRLPQDVRDQCECLDFEMHYFDGDRELPGSGRLREIFVSHAADSPAFFWFYKEMPLLGHAANPIVIG